MFEIPPEYVTPYLISNAVAFVLFLTVVYWPNIGRIAFGLMFIAAGSINGYTALTDPLVYLDYGELAWSGAYRAFILGPFSGFVAPMVVSIAVGQLVCGGLLFAGGRMARWGALGAGIFFLAIAPLGVGSAFPFSIISILALIVLDWRLQHPSEHDRAIDEKHDRQRKLPLVS